MTNNNPFETLERTFERMSRQFDEAARAWDRGEAFEMPGLAGEKAPMDLLERDEEYVVTVDLPGFERDDIEVTMVENRLQIDAERDEETDEDTENYVRRERRHRSVSRSIRLPDDIDPEGIGATAKHGVLTVTVPRTHTEAESRTIEIESE
jgi:HSP20 family protein